MGSHASRAVAGDEFYVLNMMGTGYSVVVVDEVTDEWIYDGKGLAWRRRSGYAKYGGGVMDHPSWRRHYRLRPMHTLPEHLKEPTND